MKDRSDLRPARQRRPWIVDRVYRVDGDVASTPEDAMKAVDAGQAEEIGFSAERVDE